MKTRPIDWSDALSVGDDQMDCDHRLFVETLNTLYRTIDDGGDFGVIEGLLCRLVEVSEVHFVREERLMGRTRFPLRAGHVAEHSRLLHVLDAMILSYENR
jgi:hemerythrin